MSKPTRTKSDIELDYSATTDIVTAVLNLLIEVGNGERYISSDNLYTVSALMQREVENLDTFFDEMSNFMGKQS